MRQVYQKASTLLSWLGPDELDHIAELAIDSIMTVSDFLFQKLELSLHKLRTMSDTCQELIMKNRANLPPPNECDFSTEATWRSLTWFYSHTYFTRVWVIQEIGASDKRTVQCGPRIVEWERVDLVASYVTMEPAVSKILGFSDTYCWWVSTMTELTRNPRNWPAMLYLASTYSCLDPRDVIYGLRGIMELAHGGSLLDPNYSKTTLEVYRDSVEAALLSFQNTDVLTYITGDQDPSWIPRWDQSMLFRNPFRFGRSLPWTPAGHTTAVWSIEKASNVLMLEGSILDSIEHAGTYRESLFGNSLFESLNGRNELRQSWQRILKTIEESQSRLPLNTDILIAAASSFSFGLDSKTAPADALCLLHNFVAYLKLVLGKDTYDKYIPSSLQEDSSHADGHAFGKPVWDFEYPVSGFYITKKGFVGCTIATVAQGDVVFIPLGNTYPLVLRPEHNDFRIKGYTFIHGVMHGEQQNMETQTIRLR